MRHSIGSKTGWEEADQSPDRIQIRTHRYIRVRLRCVRARLGHVRARLRCVRGLNRLARARLRCVRDLNRLVRSPMCTPARRITARNRLSLHTNRTDARNHM